MTIQASGKYNSGNHRRRSRIEWQTTLTLLAWRGRGLPNDFTIFKIQSVKTRRGFDGSIPLIQCEEKVRISCINQVPVSAHSPVDSAKCTAFSYTPLPD